MYIKYYKYVGIPSILSSKATVGRLSFSIRNYYRVFEKAIKSDLKTSPFLVVVVNVQARKFCEQRSKEIQQLLLKLLGFSCKQKQFCEANHISILFKRRGQLYGIFPASFNPDKIKFYLLLLNVLAEKVQRGRHLPKLVGVLAEKRFLKFILRDLRKVFRQSKFVKDFQRELLLNIISAEVALAANWVLAFHKEVFADAILSEVRKRIV